jgi:hypothetical protein
LATSIVLLPPLMVSFTSTATTCVARSQHGTPVRVSEAAQGTDENATHSAHLDHRSLGQRASLSLAQSRFSMASPVRTRALQRRREARRESAAVHHLHASQGGIA